MPTPMFIDQPADQPYQQQERREDRRYLQLILFPDARFAKIKLASGGQAALADPPAPHLAPVEFRRRKSHRWGFDVNRLFPTKDAHGFSDSVSPCIDI